MSVGSYAYNPYPQQQPIPGYAPPQQAYPGYPAYPAYPGTPYPAPAPAPYPSTPAPGYYDYYQPQQPGYAPVQPNYQPNYNPYGPQPQPPQRPLLNMLGQMMMGAQNRGWERTHPISSFFDRGRTMPQNPGEVLGRWIVDGGVWYGRVTTWQRIKRSLGIG